MFRGELSDYHRARLDSDSLSSTLEERRVSLGRAGEWFAPLDALTEGETYSIAFSETDVYEVEVGAIRGAPFRRVWPRDAEPTRFAVYCSDRAERHAAVDLSPGLTPVAIPGNNRCFGVFVAPGLAAVFSPPRLFGQTVQTTVLSGTTTRRAEARPSACPPGRSRLAIGCAEVLDDRLSLDTEIESYWLVSGAASAAFALGPGRTAVLSGLPVAQRSQLSLRVFTRRGDELTTGVELMTGEERPHLVINEVLADALGPEPQQEWIELYNDGSRANELSEFGLVDGGSSEPTWLPEHRLEPGAFVLVAREDFDATGGWDVAPAKSTVVLRVPELVTHGLSNSGEPLALVSRTGATLSSLPSRAAKAGVSWARREPSCPDTPECFLLHEAPGASPGAPNVVSE